MKEQFKYETIKYLVDHPDANKQHAALKLGCTARHVNRMIAGYLREGKSFFVHGNRGRKPSNAIDNAVRKAVADLYRSKYGGANFTHFTELLERFEGISLSVSAVTGILEDAGIYSPRISRAKKRRLKKELEERQRDAKTKREAETIQANLVGLENAHPRRPRCAYFGEMQQMDATPHEWVPGQVWHLHLAIDDASGRITGAWFDEQETLNGYYHVLHQILTEYGIPYKLLTDNRSVFYYKKKKSPSVDEDSHTQFAYACHQLGIELETTSVPQAKGRVERLNQTLQSRLPVEFRLAGIATLDAANEFLNSYIKEFNAKFSLPLNGIKSAFEMQPPADKINLILARLSERSVDCGSCVKYKGGYYRMVNTLGKQVHYRKNTKVIVVEAFDGRRYACVNDAYVFVLELVPDRQETSPAIDGRTPKSRINRHWIPPMGHPWRRNVFQQFVQLQHELYAKEFEDLLYSTENIYWATAFGVTLPEKTAIK